MIARQPARKEEHMSGISSQPRAALAAVAGAAMALVIGFAVLTGSALASGDYGPDTCLNGYVWRDAVPGDHVCVTPATRTQAAYDNSKAAARRSPTGSPYGPDTCIRGYVWREAVPGDRVCVTPATRTQAANDNGQASARRDSLHVWDTVYGVSIGPPQQCYGDNTCSSSEPSGYPAFSIHADHVNVGSVWVELRRLGTNALLNSWLVDAYPAGYTPGGHADVNTGVIDCSGEKADSYFIIRDNSSDRWSAPLEVATQCGVL